MGEFLKRRIAAILAADMVGFSRLIERDEAGTLSRQKRHMIDLIRPGISRYNGEVVKLTGDGLIAEFASVVEAVECAVEIQKEMEIRERGQPDDLRICYRVAINLGDVVFEDGDVYGDGVNIAARLEELAEPGGVVVSGTAHDLLKRNVDVRYVALGEKRLKNISTPVRVYQVVPGSEQPPASFDRRLRFVFAALLAAALAGLSGWFFADWTPREAVSDVDHKLSVAVLPLDNLSGDTTQDWFANGLSEDLTTDLSRSDEVFVIARNSVFSAAAESDDPIQIARELKVAYVVEGSVRRVGDSLRLNVQLIDAATGGHLWADRYDGSPEDVLMFMEQVAGTVLQQLGVEQSAGESQSPMGETESPQAFDAFLEGWNLYLRQTPADLDQAIPLFEKAIELDPEYGRAYAALAATYYRIYEKFWHVKLGYDYMERRIVRRQSEENLEVALRYPIGLAHQVKAQFHRIDGLREGMLREANKAVEVEPNDPNGHDILAMALILDGKPVDAIAEIEKAMDLEPHYPAQYLLTKGIALFDSRDYEAALTVLSRAIERNPADTWPNYWIAASQAKLNDVDAANATRKGDPNYSSIDSLKLYLPYKDSESWEHLVDGLRKAGYP